jgi:hypothetical protein
MTDTPQVHQVYIQIKPVSRALPTGQVAYGFYTVVDGVLTMTDAKGIVLHDDAERPTRPSYSRTTTPTSSPEGSPANCVTRCVVRGTPPAVLVGRLTTRRATNAKIYRLRVSKSEYGTGSWVIIDNMVFVRTAPQRCMRPVARLDQRGHGRRRESA